MQPLGAEEAASIHLWPRYGCGCLRKKRAKESEVRFIGSKSTDLSVDFVVEIILNGLD